MPNVTLHFMAANDLNGDPLLEVTDLDDYLKEVELRVTLGELGGGSVRFSRDVGFALFDTGAIEPEVFVRVLVHAYSGTDYFWGFFLDKREQKVVGEEGTEEYIFGGPGPKYYLDRAILTDEQFTGTGWQVDTDNGVFTFRNETHTAGRILNRLLSEAQANPVEAIPDLTWDFTDTDDSDSDPWTNTVNSTDDDFALPIGQSLLHDLWELEDAAELETRIELGSVSNRVFRLQAYPSIGTDHSGDAFAADVLRFAEASSGANPNGNIGSPAGGESLWVKGQSLRKATHVLVRGKDGVYATAVKSGWSPGDYTKWASIDYEHSNNPAVLEDAGTRWIRRQDAGDSVFDIPIVPGTDATDGRYFPDPDGMLWVGNTFSLFTGGVTGTPLDYRDDPFRISGIKLKALLEASDASDALKRALSWEVVVQVNTERGGASSPSQGTTGASRGGCNCNRPNPKLCPPAVEGATDTELYHLHWPNDTQETVAIVGGGTAAWPFSAPRVEDADSSPSSLAHDADSGHIGFKLSDTGDGSPELPATAGVEYRFEFDTRYGGGIDIEFKNGTSGLSATRMATHLEGMVWVARSFTITAPPTTDRMIFKPIGAGHYAHVRIYEVDGTEGSNEHNGVSTDAARCDHTHPGEEHDHDDAYTPLGHNHLVGDLADVDLSTPPTDGQILVYDATTEMWVPGDDQVGGSSGGGIGPILITSVPAGTPLIFGDLLQNSEGTDLLYASES